MTGFSDLPNELVIRVWHHVLEPEAVENFALTSKTIYALGGAFIAEHNELKAQFSIIAHYYNCGVGSSPVETLKSILLNPRAALYVRELSVDGWRVEWDDIDEWYFLHKPEHMPYPEDTVELFRQSIMESPLILEDEVEHWLDVLGAGDEIVIHSLMLAKLPSVRAICIGRTSDNQDQTLLFRTVEAIARSRDTEALSRLVKVQIGSDSMGFEWVRIFAAIPSVKTIESSNHEDPVRCSSHCHGCRKKYVCAHTVHDDRQGRIILPPRISAVAHLAFSDSDLNTRVLCRYLEGLRALESFEYLGDNYGPRARGGPRAIVDALLTHAKSTLQKLRLRPNYHFFESVGTLVGFEVMKELEIDYENLPEHRRSGRCKLVDVLPPSIEMLHLSTLETKFYDAVKHNVLEVIRKKSKALPNLKLFTIELCEIDEDFMAEMASMKPKCEAVGIVFNVIVGSLEIRNPFSSSCR